MKILQSRSFERKIKKFTRQEKNTLDKQVEIIAANPSIEKKKKGISVGGLSINLI